MKVLLTGGAGYIGSNILSCLLNEGYEVVVFDNFTNTSKSKISFLEKFFQEKINIIEGDLIYIDQIRSLFKSEMIDIVIHLAGLKSVSESIEKPFLYYQNNIFGTINLLQAMEESKVKRIIFSSSATIYGDPQQLPIKETHPINPKNIYGATKATVENLISSICNEIYEFNAVSLRYFNPVGSDPSFTLGEFMNKNQNNLMPIINLNAFGRINKFEIFGSDFESKDGYAKRDFIHITDLANAHLCSINYLANQKNYKNEFFNIGTGKGTSVKELISCYEATNNIELNYSVGKRRKGDIAISVACPKKANEDLHWKAIYSLEDMCKSSFEFYNRFPEALSA
tara:strand:+ start:1034 stop:2053 length:1020 start_codon:yes stop_codon:yes gene_type:complete